MTSRKEFFTANIYFLTVNFFIAIAINFIYLFNTSGISGTLSQVFSVIALLSNTFMIYLILALLNLSVVALFPRKTVFYICNLLTIICSHLLFFADATIYKIFRFHINGLVLNLFMTEGSWDSVKVGTITMISFITILILLVLFEILLLKKTINRQFIFLKPKYLVFAIIFFIISDKTIYAVADLFGKTEITSLSKAYPLYQPLTIKRMMRKTFGIDMAEKVTIKASTKGHLNYPINPITYAQDAPKPNIIILVIDAMRFDTFNESNTPRLWEYSKDATVFSNHFSGGNASRFGVFSILYGVNAFYWQNFLTEQKSPVLMDELQKLGYQFKINSSTKLTYPEFRRTAFVNLANDIDDEIPGKDATEKDLENTKRVNQYLQQNHQQPFFLFSWLDCPHGPYSYPDQFEKFKPSKKSANYLTVSKNDINPLRNSYKNAVYYNDHLIGTVLDEIKKQNLFENSIVIVTADHGEEFKENGFYGHTSAFTRYQTKVPFLLFVPEKYRTQEVKNVTHLTSHLDVVPTILTFLKCKNPYTDYSHGKFLLDGKGHDYVVASGWNDAAMIDNDNVIVFSLESYNASKFEVRDNNYEIVKNKNDVMKNKTLKMQSLIKSFRDYLR